MSTEDDVRRQAEEGGLTRRRLLEMAAALGAAAAVPSWLAPDAFGASAATLRTGGQLRVACPGAGTSETLDPGKGVNTIDVNRSWNLFDTLARQDPKTGEWRPYLARSIEPNKNGTVWQIKLRSGVQFHNGKPLTTDDVIYSLTRPFDTKSGMAGSNLAPFFDPNTGFKKVDDLTLIMQLTKPVGDLASHLYQHDTVIFPNGFTDFSHPIGTGPFMFGSFNVGDRSVFPKNPNYWISGRPFVDELELISIADPQARVNALLGGQVDIVESFDYTQAKIHRHDTRLSLVLSKNPLAFPFVTRENAKPFTDNRVRLAFKYLADRQKMLDVAYLGFGQVGNDMFGKGLPGYPNEPQRHYDPERAKHLLKQAGYANGLTVPFYGTTGTGSTPSLVAAATAYAETAKAARVNLKLRPWPPGMSFTTAPKFSMFATNWGGTILDIGVWMLSNSSYNEGWHHKNWDKLYFKALAATDPDKRAALTKQLNEIWYQQASHMIWAFTDTIDAVAPNVRGMIPAKTSWNLNSYDFKDVSFA